MKNIILPLLFIFFLVSCGSKDRDQFFMEANDAYTHYEEAAVEEPIAGEAADLQEAVIRKIIKNGRMDLEVQNLGSVKRKLDTLVERMGGYYEREQLSNSSRQTTLDLLMRIPADRFEQLIAQIEQGDGEITGKAIEAKDVTEEFIDLETRLANKKNYMERYQELLKSAKSVKDILEIQENIRQLQEELESTQGRIQYLSKQVIYSTLYLTINQPKEYSYLPGKRDRGSEKLKQSFFGGWHAFVDFLYILLYNWVWVLLVFVAVTLWLIRRRKRRSAGRAAKT